MLEQIIMLLQSGYTKDEISALLNGGGAGSDPHTEPPVSGAADPAPAVPDHPAAPVPDPPVTGGAPDMGTLLQAINQMGSNIVSALQKAQIGGTPNPYNPDPMAQIDAITAQIINPTHNKEV